MLGLVVLMMCMAAGVALCLGVKDLLVWMQDRKRHTQAALALLEFATVLLTLSAIGLFSADSPSTYVLYHRIHAATLLLWSMAFLGLVAIQVDAVRDKAVLGLWGALSVLLVATFACPYELLFLRTESHRWVELSWLGSFYLADGTVGLGAAVRVVVWAVLAGFVVRTCRSLFGTRNRAVPTVIALGMVGISGVMLRDLITAGMGPVVAASASYLSWLILLVVTCLLSYSLRDSGDRIRDRYEQLMQRVGEVGYFFSMTPDGTICDLSSPASENVGAPIEGVVGRNWREFIPDAESRARIEETDRKCIAESTIVEYEFCSPGRDQEHRFYKAKKWPVIGEHGQVIGMEGVSVDITDQKAVEDNLRTSEAKWRSVAENSPDHIVIMDRDLRVTYINRIGESEVSSREPSGPWGEFFTPESFERAKACYARTLATARPGRFEAEFLTPQNEPFFLDVRAAPIVHDDEVVGLALSCRDVTAGKRMEAALREGEERFRLAFEEGPVGRYIAEMDGCYTQVNPAFCQLLGYSEEELTGMSWTDVMPEKNRRNILALDAQMFWGDIDSFQVEKAFVRKDGKEIFGRLTVCAMRDGESKLSAVLGMVEDITKQKEAEKTLRRAERMASVGTLAAGIAHEVNNPLQGIVFFAEAAISALNNEEDSEEAKDAVQKIQSEAFRCAKIVKGVLQFARDDRTPKSLDSLQQVTRRAAEMMYMAAEAGQVKIEVETADEVPPVLMNPIELEQVLANLIANAIHASPNSTVSVRVWAEGDEAKLAVEDHGYGMSEEQMTRMFEPFYTTRQQEGGTGLGLSLTYGIVEEHGGQISVQSTRGEGTTITVSFPIDRTLEEDAQS